MSIGLALSGGGAKGIAHIGVIKALVDNGIDIDYISGTSSGSIVAALFASGYSPDEILRIVINNKNNIIDFDNKSNFNFLSLIINKKINISGFIKGNNLENLIRRELDYKNVRDIKDIKMPIAITTVNLKNGKTVYFTNKKINLDNNDLYKNEGDLASIVRASSSVPGVFKPKFINNEYYIDGGVKVNTPVNILKKMGADKIIAVTFDESNRKNFGIKNVTGISNNTIKNIFSSQNNEEMFADVNIKLCIKNISLFDTSKPVYLANKGYNIVNQNINKIRRLI